MTIELSKTQEEALRHWCRLRSAAHQSEGVPVPGYDLVISFSPLGIEATARWGLYELELGDVQVTRGEPKGEAAP